jgi:SSS family solute:Na+ symporter
MIFLVLLSAYSLLMIALGYWVSRRAKASSDFFVAGRGLSAGLVFSTLLAANIGAGSTVGATGLGYRDGLSAWWWVGSAGLGSLILAFTVGPRIWRVARDQNLYTVGDYLEFRYNRATRGLVALLLWGGSLAILAGQLIAIAWILNVVAGLSKPVGCVIGAVVTTVYFTLGGLHSTARVNVLQLAVKLIGFSAVLIYLLHQMGWWALFPTIEKSGVIQNPDSYLDLTGIGAAGVWRYLALLAPSFVISPGLLQKVFGAKDENAVRRGVGLNAVGLLAFAAIPALLGIIAHQQFPGLDNRELALPTLLTQSLPFWLGGLLLAAVFSAELSSADAVLFMLTTSLSKDLYRSFINPQADDRRLVQIVRATALICGALGAALAIAIGTVTTALTIFYTLISASLLLPILAGLYLRKVTTQAALVTIVVSTLITFALEWLSGGQGHWGIPSLIWGTAAGLIAMTAVSLLNKSEPKEETGLTG